MKKDFVMMLCTAMGALFLTGLLLVFCTGKIGSDALYLAESGFVQNCDNELIDEDISNFNEGSMLLAIVGGMGALVSGAVLFGLKKAEKVR